MQDYNVLVTEDRYKDAIRFWRERLSSVNGGFRWEVNEAAGSQGARAAHRFSLSERAALVLSKFAGDDLGRLSVTLTAAAYVLSRYFQQSPVVIKTPNIAPAGGAASLPVIIDVCEEWTIAQYLRSSARTLSDTYSSDGFPLDALLERDYNQSMGRITNVAVSDERLHARSQQLADADIEILLNCHGAGHHEIRYASDRVESFLVRGFADHVVRALEQFEDVKRKLGELELLSSEERAQLLSDFNATSAARSPETVVSLFEAQAARTPSAVALDYQGRTVTYERLNAQANQLARYIAQAFEAGFSRRVGVMLDRSPEMVVAVLGALKAGAAYVPIDSEYPADRINYILEDAGIELLITQSDYILEMEGFAGRLFAIDLQLAGLTASEANLDRKPLPEDVAYIIYTSGSTGKPKGCQLEHRNLSSYLGWAASYYFADETEGNFGLYSSLSFDFTITHLFCPLVRGRTLFIYDQSQEIHEILAQAFGPRSSIDTMKLTPSHIRLLDQLEIAATAVKRVIAGGEELRPSHVQSLVKINPAIEIYNEYGPTEAAVGCIVKRISPLDTEILIGKPIENMRVYILDARGRLVPVGVRGEICVAGDGVARGYNNRPELTAEKFIPNPFKEGERLYRTGDVGRWLPDGNIQCFGRTDDQVKVRGFRVELGEIERALAMHEDVRQAVVVAREDHPGEKRLVAYLVGDARLSAPALREFAASRLPSYMVPACFVFLEKLPLNSNGKVDRRALPAPEEVADADEHAFVAPATVYEEELLRIWQEALHRERISVHDNFFASGGDSLSAVQVISRVWARLGVEIQIEDVFDAPTIAALASRVRAASERPRGEELPPIVRVSRSEPIPLSFAQQRLWFLAHLEGRTATYNVVHALMLEGDLDAAALENSIRVIIDRHEVLRTNLVDRDGWPFQIIRSDHKFTIDQRRLEHSDPGAQLREAQAIALESGSMPFDLSRDLLLRASLLRLSAEAHVLIVVMHHIIWDAWSAGIFNRELAQLYNAFTTGDAHALPPLDIQYADFAHWQRNALALRIDEQLSYWRDKLAGAPPLLELRTDRPRPAVQSYSGAKEVFEVGADLAEELRALGRERGATMFMTLLAAYAIVLYRNSAQTDIVVGSPAASRTRREIEPLMGFFINMLALRLDLAGDPTLAELLNRVRQTAIEAYRHQEAPFDLVVEAVQPGRNLAHNPIFQVSFTLQEDALAQIEVAGLKLTPIEVPGSSARFDMELSIEATGGSLIATFDYNSDLFDPATIAEMREQFIGTLRAMASDCEQRLSELSLLGESEWQAALQSLKESRARLSPREPAAQPQRKGYVAARNATEETLARIWAEVLGRARVGIYDNFFELGGDSILSIQVISRAGKAGLGLTTQQIFRYQTIAELAQVAGGKTIEAEQGVVTGSVPLTPIQRWFFEREQDAINHFNQSLLLETPPGLEIESLQSAIDRLVLHHDALRARFELIQAEWAESLPGEAERLQVDYIDLSDFPEDLRQSVLEETASRMQASLNITSGPIARVAYFDFGEGESGRLLLVIHHLAVDGVSWRILVEDLITLYGQSQSGASLQLPPKTTSVKEWSLRLHALARSPELAEQMRYWADHRRNHIKPLPLDRPLDETANTVADSATFTLSLSAADTRRLLEAAPRHLKAQAGEVLLASLAYTLKEWSGEPRILIDLEGHGREEIFQSVDLSRTVGWFTTIFPALFDLPRNAEPRAVLSCVKEQLGAIPQRGIGYGLLRYCSDKAEIRSRLMSLPAAQVAFNYLGQTDHVLAEMEGWRVALEATGYDQNPEGERAHLIEVNSIVSNEELRVDWIYNAKLHDRETIARVAGSFHSALRSLLALCLTDRDKLLESIPDVDAENVEDVYALSPLQSGMLFRKMLEPDSAAYFEQLSCTIEGALDRELFRLAWQKVVERHSVLRTAFFCEGIDEPLQVVFRSVELPWREQDWQRLGADEQREQFERFLEQDRSQKFDLSRAPAFRITLIRFGPRRYGFCWSHHHILLDGWSVSNILQEVIALYGDTAETGLPEAVPYRSYIDWIEDQDAREAEEFWRGHLSGFASRTRLPYDREQSSERHYDKEELILSQEFSDRLRDCAQQRRVTLNTLARAVWAVALSRYGDEPDVCFGVTVAGRPAALSGVETMAGLFINTLPLRVVIPERRSLATWLAELQQLHADVEKYSHSSLADVQRWAETASGERLFDSILVFENYPVDQALNRDIQDLSFNNVRAFEQTEYPLTLAIVPDRELYIRLRYDRERFDSITVRRMLSHIRTALESFVANPDRAIEELEIISEAERRQLDAINETAARLHNETVHALFERQAAKTPEATAVICGQSAVNFQQLNERSNQLASFLASRKVGPDGPVALLLERSTEMIVAVFGVLKAGGAFMPLDVTHPQERLRLMLEDSGARVILTQERLLAKLPSSRAQVVCIDQDWPEISLHSAANGAARIEPENLAYVIYTSGTSGEPKGVAVTHLSVVNLLAALDEAVYSDDRARTLRVSVNGPLAFDTSIKQIIQLLNGHALVIIPEEVRSNPAAMVEHARATAIDVLDCTPSHLEVLIEAGLLDESKGPAARKLLVGGEPLPEELWKRLAASPLAAFNVYGPTEATVDATVARITTGSSVPTIGAPVRNVRAYILDRKLRRAPVGAPGALYIGGAGLARGYLNGAALTAASFIPDPFSGEEGARLYNTGDVVRLREDGHIEFINRRDGQIKVRGFRVELREIEAALEHHAAVAQAIVAQREDGPEGKRLVAYVVNRARARVDRSELRSFLSRRLPEYMIPDAYVEIETVPLTSRGKLDRARLPAPDYKSAPSSDRRIPPRDETERRLVDIWQQALGVSEVGVRDNFFELGGHSIVAMRVVGRIHSEFGKSLPLAQLFAAPTVEQMAAALRDASAAVEWQPLVRLHRGGGDAAPVFLLPGAGGNVLYYYALAKHLGKDRPVYALQAVGLDGVTPPLTSIEEIARRNVEQIRRAQADGPYFLAGHSFGGKVAFEMSQQLRDAGCEVGLVAIFDTPAPVFERIADRADWDEARWLAQMVREVEEFLRVDLAITQEELRALAERDRLDFVIDRIQRAGWWIPGGNRAQLRAHLQVYRTNFQIDYVIREDFHPVPIALFKASLRDDEAAHPELGALLKDRSWGWGRFSSEEVPVYELAGDHLTMMSDGNAAGVAALLTSCLDRSRAR